MTKFCRRGDLKMLLRVEGTWTPLFYECFGVFLRCGRGKKGIHPHCGTPLFSVCRLTPRSQSKKPWVYTIFLGKQGKRVYTIGPERRVFTIQPETPAKKKRRVSTVVVYVFIFPAWPLQGRDSSGPNQHKCRGHFGVCMCSLERLSDGFVGPHVVVVSRTLSQSSAKLRPFARFASEFRFCNHSRLGSFFLLCPPLWHEQQETKEGETQGRGPEKTREKNLWNTVWWTPCVLLPSLSIYLYACVYIYMPTSRAFAYLFCGLEATRTHTGTWPLLAYKIPPIDYRALGPDIRPNP